jgi:hypothetical protein
MSIQWSRQTSINKRIACCVAQCVLRCQRVEGTHVDLTQSITIIAINIISFSPTITMLNCTLLGPEGSALRAVRNTTARNPGTLPYQVLIMRMLQPRSNQFLNAILASGEEGNGDDGEGGRLPERDGESSGRSVLDFNLTCSHGSFGDARAGCRVAREVPRAKTAGLDRGLWVCYSTC